MRQHIFFLFIIIFLATNFVACKDVAIVHDLNERDANEILVLLAKNNIKANKIKEVRNQEVYWSIHTPPSDELQARSILVSNNLPRIRHGGLEGICKEGGLIVTPIQERCRILLAFKGEIINSLESIPGVVSADVVLNIPEKEEFPDPEKPQARPTASVTIQYLADANVRTRLTKGEVQEFVANSIEDLDARDVSVIISYFEQKIDENILIKNNQNQNNENKVDPVEKNQTENNTKANPDKANSTKVSDDDGSLVSVGGIVMDEDSAKKFKLISAIFLGLLLLLAAGFIYALLRMSRLRRVSSVPAVIEDDGGDDDDDDQRLLEA